MSTANQQASFFASISSFAKPYVKSANKADPLVAARIKFGQVVDEQIKQVKANSDKGYCFKKSDKGYVITLKNGPKTLNQANPSYSVATQADAVKLFEQAKAASDKGEFDELFKATMRKPAEKKDGEEAAAAGTQKPAASAKSAKK
jgi:hypothetical protein